MTRTGLCLLLLAGVLVFTGCPEEGRSHAEEVCLDTVDEFTDAFVIACGTDYYESHQQILELFRYCEGVAAIRDETSLYAECFPALDYMTCTQFEQGPLPASCEQQILFP